MADFALWATACETALWPAGTFWSAYCGNRDEAVEGVIDADPIAAAVRALMATRTEWTGTASELLGALAEWRASALPRPRPGRIALGRWRAGCAGRRPSCARSASRSASTARAGRGPGSSASPPPATSRARNRTGRDRPHRPHRPRRLPKSNPAKASRHPICGRSAMMRTVRPSQLPTVRANPLKTNDATVADGADANPRPQSALAKTETNGWTGAHMSAAQALKAARAAGSNRHRWR